MAGSSLRKLQDIRTKLDSFESTPSIPDLQEDSITLPDISFTDFKPVTLDYVRNLITNSPNKSSVNDPVPIQIAKDCLHDLLPIITNMINLSLKDGFFPDKWKEAMVRPKLKKPNSDLIFKNFRPLLSKLAEKTVVHQTVDHMNYHELFPEFQSAYRLNHSTETALLRVRNDLLMNTNSQSATLLVFLDLSAAFDTIDHAILLRRLQTKFGFTGKTLA